MDYSVILTVAILEYIFCVIGISAQVLVCVTILKYRKSTFSNTFYRLVLALAIPDTVHLISEICCALPAVFHGLEDTPKLFMYSCGFFANCAFWGIAPLMLVIAFNRYMAVCHFKKYQEIFKPQVVNLLIFVCLISSFIVPGIAYGCKCYYDFGHAWLYTCFDGGCMDFALTLNSVIANTICGLVVLIYLRIFIQYKSIRKQMAASSQQSDADQRRRAKESTLMIQFSLISTVLIADQIFFWIFLKVSKNGPTEMILNFLGNLNSCVSPFLYLTFGSEIRSRLPWKKATTTQVAPSRSMGITVTKVQSVAPAPE